MLSRLATVLHELSGEEGPDGEPQGVLVPQPPPGEGGAGGPCEAPQEGLERLAHLEQMVVQLKELVRDKDTQLKNERELAEARFTKLKLQAKAKMVSLSKQVADLKGQDGATSPDSSFTGGVSELEEELRTLRSRLGEEEAHSQNLQERLLAAEHLLQEKEVAHTEQVKLLQAVVCEKDVRFQEQIQTHEEELLKVSAQVQRDSGTQQALQASQRRCEELEESLRSRTQVLEMLQQEVTSADQQKQILTAQFRRMEEDLTEACRQREEERREVSSLENELSAAREGERASREAAAAAESERADMEAQNARLLEELASCRTRLEEYEEEQREQAGELALLREEQREAQGRAETLEEVWRGLLALSSDPSQQSLAPSDPSLVLGALQARLDRLQGELDQKEQQCAQISHQMATLEEQMDVRAAAQAEADDTIQQLQQKVHQMTAEAPVPHATEPSEQCSLEREKERVLALEQQLLEKDQTLAALEESLRLAQEQTSRRTPEENCPQLSEQEDNVIGSSRDSPIGAPDLEDTPEDETTLVAEDASVLSVSADNESSPELIGPQSESPVESKAVSSDEMVTSSDSEVAHSSWTLLEAVNQDGAPEWPQSLQDLSQLQSWVETSLEHQGCSVQVESSSVVIRETVELHVAQTDTSTSDLSSSISGQAFAQALAEELQKRYSELLAELHRLRETSAESQEKLQSLEEDRKLLAAAKEEAESQVKNAVEELRSAKEELENLSQHGSSVIEEHSAEVRRLEEQISSWHTESKTREQEIQALQSELKEAQQAVSEQEVKARMLSAQLEDRELLSSELERKLQDMENSLLEYSQTTDLSNASLSEKDSEITELHLQLAQKEQEMMELSNSMSSKLLEAGEERFLIISEVNKLREQIVELEKVRDEKQKLNEGSPTVDVENDDIGVLRKEKQELETQMANMKRKLQVALVQRRELMKKVADLEEDAKELKAEGGPPTAETPSGVPEAGPETGPELQEMAAVLEEVRQALRSKEEEVEALEQRISEQDQVLAETLAMNKALSEEAERPEQADASAELLSRVSTLDAECETLQKKLLDVQESRKETIRKAKEKDRHHREQMRQQKEEYNELLQRVEQQSAERDDLLTKLRELEAQPRDSPHQETEEKTSAGGWVQEDWVDFAEAAQPKEPVEKSNAEEMEMQTLREEIQAAQESRRELEEKLQEAEESLALKQADLLELSRELEVLREKEKQVDVLLEEMDALRQKCLQVEASSELFKAEVESAAETASVAHKTSIATMQAEVEEFKHFLQSKNQEISELSQQLSEQNSLLRGMQDVVSEKDQLIASLQESLKTEQEERQRLEAEVPNRQEEEKDSEAKVQHLQRKLQAALISRKDVLKENKMQKEELAATKEVLAELLPNMKIKEEELEKLRAERDKLIAEVDRALLENESLGSSCESLKLAMEGIITEKDAWEREAEVATEEAARARGEWEERVKGMKEEYETLLKSYENVSDEAERVRRVMEAARQERQELAAKVRSHEAARLQAEQLVEEAQKEVDGIKDKMRKFAKTKQQKIMELEEENERLREMEEKKGGNREEKLRTAEVDRLKEELESLKADLEATAAQRDSSGEQIAELREQLAHEREKHSPTTATLVSSVAAVAQTSVMVASAQKETVENQSEDKDEPEVTGPPLVEETAAVFAAGTHSQPPEQTAEPGLSDSSEISTEDKLRQMEEALTTERNLRQECEAELRASVASLEQQLQESREKEQSLLDSVQQNLQNSKEKEHNLFEEASQREVQFKELRRSLEAEKDDLEERLMNQLARLNGSIAGYQQEAADTRERLANLQRDVERLEKERAELESRAQSEADRASRLEEERRQAQRERAEAEAESGKQRELEQQLKSAHREKDGSQSRAKQLEELLRDKQLELRQMQNDSIQRQERISKLESEAKALQQGREELQKQLDQSSLDSARTLERVKRAEAELASCKTQLDEAQKRASQALAEKTSGEKAALQREAAMRVEAEQTLDSVRFRLGAELKQMELRLEEAYMEQEKEEEATKEARRAVEGAERRAQQMQARLDESLARLAAFSRCMSSLQDDRDRVLDEARQWETRFNSTLQGKEAEVRESEMKAKELAEQLQKETAHKEELQLSVDRLQKADKDLQRRLQEEERKAEEARASLEREAERLQQTLAEMLSSRLDMRALQGEAEGLRQRAGDLEETAARLRADAERAGAELRAREAEERRLCLNVEQLETDLRSSKALTERVQAELNEKERREVQLLEEKEQAVTQAAEVARQEADGRAQEAEKELEVRRKELRDLKDELRSAEEEGNQRKTRLDAFMKAMGSLQDDRDRVLNVYKQLEEKHLQVMLEKDSLIQEAAGENNSLKEELRSLLFQRDDLFAERAKLSAQLHGYREELNQVLGMKESQHRQLLAAQRERIAALERRGRQLEAQVSGLTAARQVEERVENAEGVRVEMETLHQAGDPGRRVEAADAPGAEVEKLREQLRSAREQVEALEALLLREREERGARGQELEELRWEGGVARVESESAQERVAELARDLMELDQRLLREKEASARLREENQAFAGAMASLQESREQAESRAKELGRRLEERDRGRGKAAGPAASPGEVWSLKNALQALQNDRERLLEQVQRQDSELQRQQAELSRLGGGELLRLGRQLLEARGQAQETEAVVKHLEEVVQTGQQEIQALRAESSDWRVQAEQLKQQAAAALSERDQQLRQLSVLLEEARTPPPRHQEERHHGKGMEEVDSAPGGPQERSSPAKSHGSTPEVKELQRRLEEEVERRIGLAEQLVAAQERLQRHTRGEWHSAREGQDSEAAVLIEPPEGTLTRTRRGGPGLMRILRVAFCSRQKTPLLLTLYLLTVHALLLLCMAGYI